MPPLPTCCTCATLLIDENEYHDSKTEKPRRNHRLPCCGRIICARCLDRNPRFATYCPFCQTPRLARGLPSSSQATAPPPYAPTDAHPAANPLTDAPGHGPNAPPAAAAAAAARPRTPPPSYSDIACLPRPAPPSGGAGSGGDVTHFLAPTDSMQSLSLAYSVPLTVLRQHNRLASDHLLSARRTLSIPGSHYKGTSLSPRPVEGEEESARKSNLRKFMVRCKCADYKYATMYLEEHAWDLEKAAAKWWDDERWEREHPLHKGKGRLKGRR